MRIASGGDISYQDFSLGRSVAHLSRTKLDAEAFASTLKELGQPKPLDLDAVPSLQEICIRLFASSWNTPGGLAGLALLPPPRIPAIFSAVLCVFLSLGKMKKVLTFHLQKISR